MQAGMKVERKLQPTGDTLTAEVMAVHSDALHLSNFRDGSGRPLVCFEATHPSLYIVGQAYKSTALIKGTLVGSGGGAGLEGCVCHVLVPY
jgi:hypothetical protein